MRSCTVGVQGPSIVGRELSAVWQGAVETAGANLAGVGWDTVTVDGTRSDDMCTTIDGCTPMVEGSVDGEGAPTAAGWVSVGMVAVTTVVRV